jgi:transposase-like protein
MPRLSKLNSRIIVRICQGILTGASYEAAAVAAGISYETFNEWRKDAKEASKKTPSKRTDLEALKVQFSEAVDQANAELEISLMKSIKTKGKRDWKATSWILQNRFPNKYSDRKQVEHNIVEFDAEEWKKERKARIAQVVALEE